MAAPRPHPLASLIAVVARLISGVQVRWLDCEPVARQRIYFANHASHLDAAVLWASLPAAARATTSPVAGRDYWEKTAVRRYLAANVFHAILINRHPHGAERSIAAAQQVLEQMAGALGRGQSLIVFPEGTRGPGGDVAPFKTGIYYLARRRPDVELVPVYLDNLNRILPKGEVLPVPLLSSANFGPPLRIEPEETKTAFLDRAREAVRRMRPA